MPALHAVRAEQEFPTAPRPLTEPDADIATLLANRLRHLMGLRGVSVSDLATACDLPVEDVIDVHDGTAPLTMVQAVAFSDALDLHLLAFIDGIATPPTFIHPALMDREAGDIALRVAQLPTVGRAMVLALIQRGTEI